MPIIESNAPTQAPAWAVLERQLIDAMDQAAPIFVDKYTRPGGSLVWKEGYPGDGVWVDDLYEAFFNWPLFYALGGGDYAGTRAVQQWNAITQQVTYDYGRISKEFVNDDDWFHNSENYIYFYALGLSDPTNAEMMRRARRFAGFYMNEDAEVPNYDARHRIVRSPFSGSKGPLFHARYADVHYNILHGHLTLGPGFELPENWFEDAAERQRVHAKFDEVVMNGDVPVNLGAVVLVAHACLLTGEDKYRDWVVEYVEAWMQRIAANDGIIPDNVGPNGVIGENRQGQWWGGFYGWTATFSQQMIGSALTVAAEATHLLTGETRYLDLLRSQLDMLIERGVEVDGRFEVPFRYREQEGWTDFGTMRPEPPIHLWNASLAAADWERLEKLRRGEEEQWRRVTSRDPRSVDDRAWIRYLAGENPDYPEAILQANYEVICSRVGTILEDWADLTKEVDEHHWLQRNPVITEALMQLTTGGPQTVYWGGLARARVRHFDPARRRPGLPPDTAALVTGVDAEGVDLTLVNLSVHEERQILIQAGSYGEHHFERVEIAGGDTAPVEIGGKAFEVRLRPGTEIDMRLCMRMFCNKPTCAFPWHGDTIPFR